MLTWQQIAAALDLTFDEARTEFNIRTDDDWQLVAKAISQFCYHLGWNKGWEEHKKNPNLEQEAREDAENTLENLEDIS